jgi:hypothetical protein
MEVRPRSADEVKTLLENAYKRHVEIRKHPERLKKALAAFPETHPDHWYDYLETLRAMGLSKYYLMIELVLEKTDPLYEWLEKSLIPDDDHHFRVDNSFSRNILPIYPAMEFQRKVWASRLVLVEAELPRLADEIRALEIEVAIASPQEFADEDKRAALRRIRFRIRQQQDIASRLEAEILAEENRRAPPMRQKHGISTDDR